jgi:hypothetical protein
MQRRGGVVKTLLYALTKINQTVLRR